MLLVGVEVDISPILDQLILNGQSEIELLPSDPCVAQCCLLADVLCSTAQQACHSTVGSAFGAEGLNSPRVIEAEHVVPRGPRLSRLSSTSAHKLRVLPGVPAWNRPHTGVLMAREHDSDRAHLPYPLDPFRTALSDALQPARDK